MNPEMLCHNFTLRISTGVCESKFLYILLTLAVTIYIKGPKYRHQVWADF